MFQKIGFFFAALCVLSAEPARADEPSVVVVRGEAVQKIAVEEAILDVAIEVRAKTAVEVNRTLATKADVLLKALKESASTVNTGNIDLRPEYNEYNYEEGRQRLRGFVGNYTLRARTAPDKAGALIDTAFANGATRLDAISFTASDASIKKATDAALSEAVSDALRRADLMLSPLGKKTQRVLLIQEEGTAAPQPMPGQPMLKAMRSEAMAAPTPIAPEQQTIRAGVTVTVSF
ncbi:MAG: SIMPL domain-containing protein [Holosporales bacterium]